MNTETNNEENQNTSENTTTEQNPPSSKKDKEWIAWRKAKRDGRLTEHRKMLKSSAYRKAKKSEANQEDRERSR
jgi:hypothetical protein